VPREKSGNAIPPSINPEEICAVPIPRREGKKKLHFVEFAYPHHFRVCSPGKKLEYLIQ